MQAALEFSETLREGPWENLKWLLGGQTGAQSIPVGGAAMRLPVCRLLEGP